MNFTEAVKACLQNYATFTGRAGRPEYWWFALFQVVVILVLSMVNSWLGNIASLALLVPALAVGARRMHDMGKSGWWQLVWLVPLVGWAIMIYWLVQPSQGANQYGQLAVSPDGATAMPGQ
ncbi:MAG: hypothetical protein JWP65_187 [Ramlibacter sp.]|uniref:DUF805 domain-containing protein n=1 Tax=Ramlibacter sp. TaxID=1917967 RepID=UPI00263507C7|nr:DUF805 domain-containing protein [Ramlibacter sp.]MDB5749766.1 hypothetical protein [Ramlibacter sp.]